MLDVSVVTPLSGSTATPNTLLMVGGRATMVLAAAVLPLPLSNDPITKVTLFLHSSRRARDAYGLHRQATP